MFVLSGCVVDNYPPYQNTYQAPPTYTAPHYSDWQIERFNQEAGAVSNFTQVALLANFTYSYRNYESKLDKNYVYFTHDAWDEWITQFQANEEPRLVSQRGNVSIIFRTTPQINQFGVEPNTQNLWWNVAVPVDIVVNDINGTAVHHDMINLHIVSYSPRNYKIAKLSIHPSL